MSKFVQTIKLKLRHLSIVITCCIIYLCTDIYSIVVKSTGITLVRIWWKNHCTNLRHQSVMIDCSVVHIFLILATITLNVAFYDFWLARLYSYGPTPLGKSTRKCRKSTVNKDRSKTAFKCSYWPISITWLERLTFFTFNWYILSQNTILNI